MVRDLLQHIKKGTVAAKRFALLNKKGPKWALSKI